MRSGWSVFAFIVILISCTPKLYKHLYTWGKFDLQAGNEFISRIDTLTAVKEISLIDTYADGNQFRVNDEIIFIDISLVGLPSASYIIRARILGIEPILLKDAVNAFYKIGVNEFRRKDGYYVFPVVTSLFTTERGYVYDKTLNVTSGDTIQTRQGVLDYKLVLVKRVAEKWFEYKAAR